jgi:hypothetical protein
VPDCLGEGGGDLQVLGGIEGLDGWLEGWKGSSVRGNVVWGKDTDVLFDAFEGGYVGMEGVSSFAKG